MIWLMKKNFDKEFETILKLENLNKPIKLKISAYMIKFIFFEFLFIFFIIYILKFRLF
jgi:hypothetical protein